MTYLAATIDRSIPEVVREEYPAFVSFIQEYYNYLETIKVDLFSIKDIDLVDDKFLEYYRRDFAAGIPGLDSINIREFLRHAKEFYASRGSPESFAYLYRVIFNEEISFEYPGDNMLRTSAGLWEQEYFIEANLQFGTYDPLRPVYYEIKKDGIRYSLLPIRHEIVGNTLRLYVRSLTQYDPTGILIQQDGAGAISYSANHIECVSAIDIAAGGAAWQIGSLIIIPGSDRDTFARVTRVNRRGSILGIEVISFGMYHNTGQQFIISPYKYKPFGTKYNYSISGTGPYAHSLTFDDIVYDIYENVSAGLDINDYTVPEPYVLQGYFGVGQILASESAELIEDVTDFDPGGISLDDWLESRATLRLVYSLSAKNKGVWKNEDGQLSNDVYRLQDNFYYQAFSYIISSRVNNALQDRMINLAHPAGMKYFKKLALRTDIDFAAVVSRIISKDSINLFDVFFSSDTVALSTSKPVADTFTPAELTVLRAFTKILSDSIAATETLRLFNMNKVLGDNLSVTESLINKTLGKILSDNFTHTETLSKNITKPGFGETQTINDGSSFTLVNPYITGTSNTYWVTGYTSTDIQTLEIT
jgi:hypothetical protein